MIVKSIVVVALCASTVKLVFVKIVECDIRLFKKFPIVFILFPEVNELTSVLR